MSWQHWVLLVAYVVSVVQSFRGNEANVKGDLGVLGGVVGIMLLIWGQP